MTENQPAKRTLWRRHPVFFWGSTVLLLVLLTATAVVASRVPKYQRDAEIINAQMSEAERATRDRILESEARRSELAIALFQRELRMKALREKGMHLAISVEDSTLSLRHGPATLREVRIGIGSDSTINGPDGRTWRLVRALGERHLKEKQTNPTYTIPEWVYVSRGEPIPPEEERQVKGALGRYVLKLDDGTEIYSTPRTGPFTDQVKPAAFAVPERDLAAMLEVLRIDMPVYIY
ncbi:MAG: hypothetical protein KY467_06255 [Gemmatimonadetes bacterium]|nr:hypothetical protein [Gemmatimonadota bacterium]